jgi:hypothetical protein
MIGFIILCVMLGIASYSGHVVSKAILKKASEK